ncbi:MAG: Gfo/Idh/MocA family protein, partial [Bryobacteraceae bacterium]
MNRRYFLLSAAAAPVAAQTPPAPVRAAMIGTGNRGQFVLRGVLEQPGVAVTAVCDLKPDRLDQAATIAGRDKPAALRDWRELLARKDVDAVFIASPCDLHVEMAIAALKAGKHVYCEKPAGITPESIAELVRVARQSKTVFQIGQQMRSFTRLRRTIERIHEGVVGKIVMVKAQRHAGNDLAHD